MYRTTSVAPETAAAFTSKFGKQCRAYKRMSPFLHRYQLPSIKSLMISASSMWSPSTLVYARRMREKSTPGRISGNNGCECQRSILHCSSCGKGNVVFTISISATLVNRLERCLQRIPATELRRRDEMKSIWTQRGKGFVADTIRDHISSLAKVANPRDQLSYFFSQSPQFLTWPIYSSNPLSTEVRDSSLFSFQN